MRKLLLIILIILSPIFSMTQGQGNGNGPPPGVGNAPCPPNCPAIPIDSGISGLLILGAAYGIKRVRYCHLTK